MKDVNEIEGCRERVDEREEEGHYKGGWQMVGGEKTS